MSKKPAILMIVERFPPDLGGLARSGARIAGALARLGARVEVFSWTRTLPPGQLVSMPAGEASPAAAGATLHRLGLFAGQDFSMQYTQNVLEWLHQERPFDAVWGHYLYPAGFMAVMFAGLAGIDATVAARGNDLDRTIYPPGDFARLTWTLERAKVVTAVSADLAKKVKMLLGRDPKVIVSANAVDNNLFQPAEPSSVLREKLGILPEEAVLCFSGDLRLKKGLPFLLDALVAVRKKRPACLLVIGEVRAKQQLMLAQFRSEHPEAASRLLITGRLPDQAEVVEHLRLCDVFLHPSVWDGMPNALLEAMACGKICIGSDAGGIPEALVHGKNGFIIPKSQLDRLGEAILEVLAMPAADQEAMAKAARERIEEKFNFQEENRTLALVLERLTTNRTDKT